jgi:Recombination directionality factor-like
MPITALEHQQRLRQLGEIRIGHVVKMNGKNKRGEQKTRPEKLSKFRFTSPSKALLEKIADLYGGTVQPWTPANGDPAEFEVYSDATELPILIPGPRAISLWYELNDGRRLVRRCDGEREFRRGVPCVCNPKQQLAWSDDRECDIKLRLNVMLADVPAIGQWLLQSKGKNAAVEIPPMAQILASSQEYVSGRLSLEPRTTYPLEGAPFHYVVPFIEVDQKPLELMQGGNGRAAIGGGAKALDGDRKAIEAKASASGAATAQDDPGSRFWIALADSAETLEALTEVVGKARAVERGMPGDPLFDHFMKRRQEIEQGDEVVDAEIVEEAAPTPAHVGHPEGGFSAACPECKADQVKADLLAADGA